MKECLLKYNTVGLLRDMEKSVATSKYKKLLNTTITSLAEEEEKSVLSESRDNGLHLDQQHCGGFDDEYFDKKRETEIVKQDAISKAVTALIDDLGSDNPDRVKTSSGLLLSLVLTKGKRVDESEDKLSEDFIGLIIIKNGGIMAGFKSIEKNSSTPAVCENILQMFGDFASSRCLCELFVKSGGVNMLVNLVRAGKHDYSTVGHACLTLCAYIGNTVGVTVAEDLREYINTVFYGIQQVAMTEFCQRICESISRAVTEKLNKGGAINRVLEPQLPFIVSLIRKRIDSQGTCLALCKVIYSFLSQCKKTVTNSS